MFRNYYKHKLFSVSLVAVILYSTNSVLASTSRYVFLMNGNDSFVGNAGNEIVDGGTGNDTLDGGAGSNTITYQNRSEAITLTLRGSTSVAVKVGVIETDTIRNFQNVIGSNANDSLTGDKISNILEGGPGADTLNGANGTDTISYLNALNGVTVNLTKPSENTNDAQGDIYISMENISGSQHADILIGNTAANTILGNLGADVINGGGGNDIFKYVSVHDSTPLVTDNIFGFNAGTARTSVNKIDLSAIDADIATKGRQAFTYIGTATFSKVGQIRAYLSGSDVFIDADTIGNGVPNFRIVLKNFSNISTLNASDFIR